MKKIYFILVFLVLSIYCFTVSANNPYIIDDEPTLLEIEYERINVYDSIRQSFNSENTILRIGKTKSMFCGIKTLWNDSITKVNIELYRTILDNIRNIDKNNPNRFLEFRGRYKAYVYKNYPAGKVTECNYFDMTYWRYEENWEKPKWELTDSTKEYLGYLCTQAVTNYRGRTWIAWFTPDIPISEGPWKLCGLPGLILEAQDLSKTYTFRAISLRTEGLANVGYMRYMDYSDIVTRDKYCESWWKFKHSNMGAKMRTMFLKSDAPPVNVSTKKLTWDLEETNYNHNL